MVDCRAASNTTSTLVHQSASYSPLRGTEPQNNRENRPRPRLPQSRWRAAGGGQYKGKGGWRSRPPVFAGTANTTPTYQSGLPRAIHSRGFRRFHGRVRELIAPPVPFPPVSGIYVFKCAGGLWGREAENAIIYLYRKAPNSSFRTNKPLPVSLVADAPSANFVGCLDRADAAVVALAEHCSGLTSVNLGVCENLTDGRQDVRRAF